MMTTIKQYIAGIFIGISNVIPGVSGGTMAVVFNVYDKLIEAASLNFKSIKRNFVFLVTVALGILTGILVFANIMNVLLENFPNQTYGGFIGVIVGSLPIVIKVGKIKHFNIENAAAFILFFGIMVAVWLLQDQQASIVSVEVLTLAGAIGLFFAASISTFTMLVPGISGSLLLVMIGYYHAIFTFTIRQFVFPQLIIVGAGMVFGLLAGAKIVSYLLKKFKDIIYAAILGLIVGSLFPLFPSLENPLSTLSVMIVVAVITYGLNRKSSQ
jgi:putative membrane protein